MKKIVLLVIFLSSFMQSCFGEATTTIPTTTSTATFETLDVEVNRQRFVVQQVSNGYEIVSSYTDGRYNYYYLYLGRIEKTPISWGGTHHYAGIPTVLTYGRQTIQTDTVSQSRSYTVASSFSMQSSIYFASSVSASLEGFAKVGLAHGWSMSVGLTTGFSYNNTYERVQSWTSIDSESKVFTFDGSVPHGYYRYTIYSSCDTYLSIVYDIESDAYYYDYVINANNDLIEVLDYSVNGLFEKTSSEKFQIDASIVRSLPQPTNTFINPAIEDNLHSLEFEMAAVNCKLDNNFDTSAQEPKEVIRTEINPNMVKFITTNAYQAASGAIYVGSDLGLYLKLIQNPSSIGLTGAQGSNMKKAWINDDSAKTIVGTNINKSIGQGGVYVLLTYTDGTTAEFNKVNIFKNLNANSTIDLMDFVTINPSKTLSKIQVVVVYEIVGSWPGAFWTTGYTYSNWRSEVTLNIVSIR